MTERKDTTFKQVAFTHFVPCFFLGIISLFFVRAFFPHRHLSQLVNDSLSTFDFAAGFINGLLVTGLVVLFHFWRNRRRRSGRILLRASADRKTFVYGGVVGFMGGAIDILFGFHNEGILILTAMVLVILFWHLRLFAASVTDMLKPGNNATWNDVAELLRIYLTMLAGFTLVNATLEVGHIMAGSPPPFGFGAAEGEFFLNSLYFTVVTMTTLGFGDIVPATWDGKLLLIFQCLVSYVMFALMIGIITRGVTRADDSTN